MSSTSSSMVKSDSNVDLGLVSAKANQQIDEFLSRFEFPALTQRAKVILAKVLSKNARVYETDKAGSGLPAVAVYLAIDEYASTIGKKLTQKECQAFSGLGPKLFRRTLDLCRCAKDLDESKINFQSLVKTFSGSEAVKYMEIIYEHFKKSCFDAHIVDEKNWEANHILVVCAIFCWTCDHVFSYPTYRGPDVAFHCGLGWENVQKSMYYNLNPHCTEKMRELLDAERRANPTITLPIKVQQHGATPPINPDIPSGLHIAGGTPGSNVPRQSFGASSSSTPTTSAKGTKNGAPSKPSTSGGTTRKSTSSSATPAPMEIDLTVSDSESTSNSRGVKSSGSSKKRSADEEEESTMSSKKVVSRSRKSTRANEIVETEEEWMSRPNDELFFKNPGESKPEADLRVYYAWKKFMVEGRHSTLEGEIRDFVIT